MAMILAGTLSEGVKVQAGQQRLTSFSKQAKEGTSYRLFFPLTWSEEGIPEPIVTSAFGRDLDRDMLGKSFVVYNEGEVEIDPVTRSIRDLTDLPKLAAVATAFHDAECEMEKKKAEKQAVEEAELMKREVNPVTVAEALRRIDVEYHGDDTVTPRVFASKRPVISGQKTPMVTEVYAVPLNSNGSPEWNMGFRGAMDLSQKKIEQLKSIRDKKEYVIAGSRFLEVGYDYMGVSKAEAGRNAAFTGIAETLTLAAKFPELWEANKSKLDALSFDPEVMLAKNPKFAYACSTDYVFSAFNKYVSTKSLTLVCLDTESDAVKKNYETLLKLDGVKSIPSVREKIEKIRDEAERKGEEVSPVAEGQLSEEALQVAKATTLSELAEIGDIDAVAGQSELSEL